MPGEVTVAEFRNPKNKDERALNLLFLSGVNSGLLAYSVVSERDKTKPLFCQPAKLALTPDQTADIMLRWAKGQEKITDQ
jgi:Flp pilus assembly protein CpaB